MSEKLTQWQEMLATLCFVPEHGMMRTEYANTNVYPHNGQVFEDVLLVKLPSEDPPYFLMECLCPELTHLFSELGTYEMDFLLFEEKDIITVPGLYSLNVQFHTDNGVDRETGLSDPQMGLTVLEARKI